MKKVILFIIAAVAIAGCGPELYTGPLESPVGSWEGVRTEYFFNGEKTADLDTAEYTAISFYKQGLCCIEGIKGAFAYTYNPSERMLQIENDIWAVHTLTGAELVIEYLETLSSEDESAEESEESEESEGEPIEYNDIFIYTDKDGFYYKINEYDIKRCWEYKTKDENGNSVTEFWYDSHIDHFIPLVVETEK